MDLKKLTQNIDYLVFKEGIQVNVGSVEIFNHHRLYYVDIPYKFPYVYDSFSEAFSKIVSFLKVKNSWI